MISLERETVAVLMAVGLAVLPELVAAEHPATWDLSCALNAVENALLEDERETDEPLVSPSDTNGSGLNR